MDSRRYKIHCEGCGLGGWYDRPEGRHTGPFVACPGCALSVYSGKFTAYRLDARQGKGRCTADCKVSESLKCRCVCGGANHGQALIAPPAQTG